MGQLDGRKVLITGASSGIGEATAEAIVAEGGSVALGARRKDKLDELAGRLGENAHAIEADIGNEEDAKALVEGAAEAMGGLDGLINNAGVMLLGPLQGADPEEWRTMINVNCLGLLTALTTRCPRSATAGEGTSSTSRPSPGGRPRWDPASTT